LLAAVAISNALRKTIPYRWWRRIHVLNLAVWGAATVHGIGAGTDTPSGWITGMYVVSVSSVLAALAWRLGRRQLRPAAVHGLSGAAALVGMAAVIALAATPHGGAAPRSGATLPSSFSDSFSGSLSRENGTVGAMLSIEGHGTGSTPLLVRIDLVTTDGRSISDSSLQLEDSANGSICTGTVSNIGDSGFNGSCNLPTGTPRTVAGTWQLDADTVSGTLRLTP
jgi:hypothetical protein